MKSHWLKKYTKLEYLESTLQRQQLHLGDPAKWDDKNDSECIRIYSKYNGGKFGILATCLTEAPDRFHFRDVFGGREKGVCLWFDKHTLCRDIETDETLVVQTVQYRTYQNLKQLEPRLIPFAKREQYRDEQEFRVLRVKAPQNPDADKFAFSAVSIKRIYMNPWLSSEMVKREKTKIMSLLGQNLAHVRVLQNRSLKQKAWIDAVIALANTRR